MAGVDTRGQILVHAARLFGQRGYFGTSTRDIAESVGIRQPSLFYHFASKHLILAELVNADLEQSERRIEEALALDVSHAERFHFFLALSSNDYLTLPFDARGFYGHAVFSEPEFLSQREAIDRQHAHIEALVDAGIDAGEFQHVDSEFVQRAVIGLQLESMREREINAKAPISERPMQVADFVLRAILVDPERLESAGALARERLNSGA